MCFFFAKGASLQSDSGELENLTVIEWKRFVKEIHVKTDIRKALNSISFLERLSCQEKKVLWL